MSANGRVSDAPFRKYFLVPISVPFDYWVPTCFEVEIAMTEVCSITSEMVADLLNPLHVVLKSFKKKIEIAILHHRALWRPYQEGILELCFSYVHCEMYYLADLDTDSKVDYLLRKVLQKTEVQNANQELVYRHDFAYLSHEDMSNFFLQLNLQKAVCRYVCFFRRKMLEVLVPDAQALRQKIDAFV